MINYITLVITSLTLILTFFIWYLERKKEIFRLKALFDHLIFIKKSSEGHERHINLKKRTKASWPIANIDLNFYLTQLNYKIRKEHSLCFEDIRRLKKELISIFEKINTINYLWEKSEIIELKTNTYYLDLSNMIENALYEIKKIIY